MDLFLRAMLSHATLLNLKPNNPLFGSSLIEYAQIEQWNDFSATEVDANIGRWLYPRLGYRVYIPAAEEAVVAALKRSLGALNTHLSCNTYLVGHLITLADIIMGCNLSIGFRMIMTKSFTKEFPTCREILLDCGSSAKLLQDIG
uniref:GST C-terminal domain-containing protein n=1 Tax=Solanum tuberosum TaxID=4113 RepID=Q38JH0_SOLTU|nr:unknown [Solanum tuberosum]